MKYRSDEDFIKSPKLSVITVNFNGRRFLASFIESLKAQTLTPSEIIIVDNNSSDDSVAYLRESYPEVIVIPLRNNLGFSGGNNAGAKYATGNLLAFMNNDTVLEADCLENLVNLWTGKTKEGVKVGAIASKIRFYTKFLSFSFISSSFEREADSKRLGIGIDLEASCIVGETYHKPLAISGFHGLDFIDQDQRIRWTSGSAQLLLPYSKTSEQAHKLRIRCIGSHQNIKGTILDVYCGESYLGNIEVSSELDDYELEIPIKILQSAQWVINNAGSHLDRFGNAADIGINQFDSGQFEDSRELEAFCGCSVLIPRSVYRQLGGFDERFFMYYEDTDLSWRMRSAGYKILYQPLSITRHHHGGTSIEWSPLFRYFVMRNYSLMTLKNIHWEDLPRFIKNYGDGLMAKWNACPEKRAATIIQSKWEDLNLPEEIEFKAFIDAITFFPKILFQRIIAFK